MSTPHSRRTTFTALALVGVVAGMGALSYAAVPLYRLFCQVTGYGGTPKVATAPAPGRVSDRVITVRFNADTARDMPWRFQPEQREVRVRVGEAALAFYQASNPTDETIAGTATFNVTPDKAGQYFTKVACFCFDEQVLAAGTSARMPVTFFVDPSIEDDRGLDDVTSITLSYTFFRTSPPAEPAKGQTPLASTSRDGDKTIKPSAGS